jgi:MSHA biogenesis protein MshJ
MKAYWLRYLAWFAALKEREKKIVAVAVLVGGVFLGYTYGIEPGLLAARRDARAVAESTAALSQISQQLAVLQGGLRDPDIPLRAELDALRKDIRTQDERFVALQQRLVSPSRMTGLLESFLGRNAGLQLVSLRSLPPLAVGVRKASPAAGKETPAPQASAAESANAIAAEKAAPKLFRHGMEIKLAGSYHDLLGYVRSLESAPQRVIWEKLELDAGYPKSQLTLTISTLSLDKSWLTL